MQLSLGNGLGRQQKRSLVESIITAPQNVAAPQINGDPASGATLSSTTGAWSGGGLTIARQWQRNGSNIAGQTGSHYVVQPSDFNQQIRVYVTAVNTAGSASTASNAVQILYAIPEFTTNPVASGIATPAEVLSCNNSTATGNVTSYNYQWYLNGNAAPGATTSSYTVPANIGDGDEIRCMVTASNMAGSDTVFSNTIVANMSEGVLPVISGTPYPGNSVTSTQATQWFINGTPVSGQTGSSFNISHSQVNPGDVISQDGSNTLTVGNYDADAAIDIAAVISAGSDWGTNTAQRNNNKWRYSELITAWKSSGAYSTSYFYRVLAGPTTLSGVFACGRNGSITNTNFVSGDLNRLTGLKGSSSKYLNSGVAANAYPTNDCLAGLYLTETITTGPAGSLAILGDVGTGASGSIQLLKDSTDRTHVRMRSTAVISGTVPAASTWSGFTSIGRNNATTCEFHSNRLSKTETLASTGSLTSNMFFYSRAGGLPSDPRAALIWFSNFVDENAIHDPMQTYLSNLI